MQLQVECGFSGLAQPCSLCEQSFERKEARVLLCNDQGDKFGEVCPQCIRQGTQWLNHQFERLVQQISRSHLLKPMHSPLREAHPSDDRQHDPSQGRSKSLHSTAF